MKQPHPISRPRSESDYALLKQASRRLIKACGGLEAAAMITRVRHSELARYYDPSEKLFMPIDVMADLEAISRNPLVTRCLAQMQDFSLIPLQLHLTSEPGHHWTALLASLGEETAAALKQVGAALAEHGTLTAQSMNNYQLTLHLDNLVRAALQLKACITQRQERGAIARQVKSLNSETSAL
ncbi:MAG TPA: hypothetical protein VFW37_09600 [Alphaproteobacteria bacterium]|nr:hypothetical protein [Alphaproteobacteria bacterium]